MGKLDFVAPEMGFVARSKPSDIHCCEPRVDNRFNFTLRHVFKMENNKNVFIRSQDPLSSTRQHWLHIVYDSVN